MPKDTVMHSPCKANLLRYLLPVLAFGLIILNFVYFVDPKDGDGSAFPGGSMPVEKDMYMYPMYDITLAFGDSITQLGYENETRGWVSHLSDRYVRRMDILNRGFSGYNTTRAKQVAHSVFPVRRDYLEYSASAKSSSGLLGWLSRSARTIKKMSPRQLESKNSRWPRNDPPFPKHHPRVQLCILFFGANDAADPRDDRYTPLEEYPDNMRYIINLLRNPKSVHYSPDTRILIITPPAVGDKMSEEYFRRYGWTYGPHKNTVTQKYAEAAVKVANDLNIPYIDMWTAIEERMQESRKKKQFTPSTDAGKDNGYDGYDEFLSDGLHLNSKGNELLFKLLLGKIYRKWPELHPFSGSEFA